MYKKLFNEKVLSKNISSSIKDKIDKMFPNIDEQVFEEIYNSEELKNFTASIRIPEIQKNKEESLLFLETKDKILNKKSKNKH